MTDNSCPLCGGGSNTGGICAKCAREQSTFPSPAPIPAATAQWRDLVPNVDRFEESDFMVNSDGSLTSLNGSLRIGELHTDKDRFKYRRPIDGIGSTDVVSDLQRGGDESCAQKPSNISTTKSNSCEPRSPSGQLNSSETGSASNAAQQSDPSVAAILPQLRAIDNGIETESGEFLGCMLHDQHAAELVRRSNIYASPRAATAAGETANEPYSGSRCPRCAWALYDGDFCQNKDCAFHGKSMGHHGFKLTNEDAEKFIRTYLAQPADAGTEDGAALIAAERLRQIEKEGWTREHDIDQHGDDELVFAAIAYLNFQKGDSANASHWPFEDGFKPTDRTDVRNLVKAGALIAAEIDRIRAARKGAL